MRDYRKIICYLFLTLSATLNFAQNSDYIQLNQGIGKLIIHSPRLTEVPEKYLFFTELSYAIWGEGNKYWHKNHNYPSYGLAFRYNTFGLADIYGSAFSILPFITWKFGNVEKSFLSFRFGAGFGYATKPYNRTLNPLNRGLSTNWNNITSFSFYYNYGIDKNWKIHLGIDFSHLSNASTRKPNTGLNQYFGQIGITRAVGNTKAIAVEPDTTMVFRKWGLSYSFNRARREHYESSGPRFTVLHQALELSYRISPVGAFTLGIDYEWHEFEEFFKIHTRPDQDPDKLRSDNDRWAIAGGYEIGMGRVALQIIAGAYLHPEKSVFIRFPVYNRLKCKFYFLEPVVNQWTVYGVIALKSHVATAEYFSLGIGASVFTQ